MASIDRLATALKNADAAGDVEAARIFAAEIRKLQGTEGNAITDIPKEIGAEFQSGLDKVKGAFGGTADKGVIQQTIDVGKAPLGLMQMAFSPIMGAAKSVGGHLMADAIQGAGGLINPEAVAKEDPNEVYEASKAGVETALTAGAPRGASLKGIRALPFEPPSAKQLKDAATAVYDSPQVKSIAIPPNDVVALTGGIQNQLVNRGFRPTHGSASGTFAELGRLTPSPNIASVGVDDIRAARMSLNRTAKQVQPDMAPTPDAEAARDAIDKIDDFLDTLSPDIRTANQNYAAGKRAKMLDYRTMKADRNAAKSGSGMNMENTMRQAVDKIGDRGLSQQEIAARDRIVLGTKPRNALRTAGKLGVDGGLSLMLHAGAGLGSGGMTVPVTAVATMARKIGEILTRHEIKALNKSIRSRSPLAQALMAQPQFAKIPKGAKAIAAALLSQGIERPALSSVMPSYAEQNQR